MTDLSTDPSLAALSLLTEAGTAAAAETDPEAALHAIVSRYVSVLGDRSAHLRPGALLGDERQFMVAGAFVVTPDESWHMLVGNSGFPPEQRRLMVPIDAGHPGRVRASREALLLENTDDHGSFRQYLNTARMGSSIYAPMLWEGRFLGQIVLAAQARWTLRPADLAVMMALAPLAAAIWIAKGGPRWLEGSYPPADGWRAAP
jgi:hypothetical protein